MKRGGAIAAGALFVVLVPVSVAWLVRTQGGSERSDLARSQVRHLGGKVAQFSVDTSRLPKSLGELNLALGHGPYASEGELLDPWGRPYFYQSLGEANEFTVFTLGSNGRLGGRGDEADHFFDSTTLREDTP